MPPIDYLPVVIEECRRDDGSVIQVLARCANAAIALGAYPGARGLRPKSRIMVRDGARVIADSDDLDRASRRYG